MGHVMRIGNDRITKAVVLGWWEELKEKKKMVKGEKKTGRYWKGMLRNAGVNWTQLNS